MKCGLSAAAGPAASTIADSAAPRGPRSKNRSRRICTSCCFHPDGVTTSLCETRAFDRITSFHGRRKRGHLGDMAREPRGKRPLRWLAIPATADDDWPTGGKGTAHRRPCSNSARAYPQAVSYATLPVRHLVPDSSPSKPVSGITRTYRAVTYSFYVLLVKNLYQRGKRTCSACHVYYSPSFRQTPEPARYRTGCCM